MPLVELAEARQGVAALEARAAELPSLIATAARIGDVGEWMRQRMELDAIGLELSDARAAVLDAQAAEHARRETSEIADSEARIRDAEARVESCRKAADEYRRTMPRDESGRASERDKTRLAELQRAHRDAVQALRHARNAADRARGMKSGPGNLPAA